MSIPDYQTLMLPVLQVLSDKREYSLGEVVDRVCEEFDLSAKERQQLLPSGQSTVIGNRTGWARTYLKKAGLVESTRRGFFRITERGGAILEAKPPRIDNKFLEQFPEFLEFRERRRDRADAQPEGVSENGTDQTPEEALDAAYERLRADLEVEVLDQVKAASPAFFERLVVDLLVRMGYQPVEQVIWSAIPPRVLHKRSREDRIVPR